MRKRDPEDHGDHDGHDHGRAPIDLTATFLIGIALNLAFVIIEAASGWIAGSMALISDAGHNLSDVLGLALAGWAMQLARRQPTATHTYGFRRGTILAALANAVLLLVAVGAITLEALRRLTQPTEVASNVVMVVAACGIIINAATAMLLQKGRKDDVNVRGAYLHMVYDALVSVGVVLTGLLIKTTGWSWLDPVVSLIIACVIALGTWELLRDSVGMSLDAVPKGVELEEVREFLLGRKGVSEVHHLHIWPISTTEVALTYHCVMPEGYPGGAFLIEVARLLRETFGIKHVTVQIETSPLTNCSLRENCVAPA